MDLAALLAAASNTVSQAAAADAKSTALVAAVATLTERLAAVEVKLDALASAAAPAAPATQLALSTPAKPQSLTKSGSLDKRSKAFRDSPEGKAHYAQLKTKAAALKAAADEAAAEMAEIERGE
jgi:hypothetical protein